MLKLKKLKTLVFVAVVLVMGLVPSNLVYAVEVSEEIIEVPQDGSKHTVVAYGRSIAIIHADNSMEIIANNPSGRIDVMIDGKVTKKIGKIIIPTQNKTNMALEEGSFIVSGITEEQADSLEKMVFDSLSKDICIENPATIEKIEQQAISVFVMGRGGELQTSDGNKASVGVLAGMQVTTPEALYEAFVKAMEESIRLEQESKQKEKEQSTPVIIEKDEDNSNAITSVCFHEWELSGISFIVMSTYEGCATPPLYECLKCGMTMWYSENYHEHGEEYCQYCGYNIYGEHRGSDCPAGGNHDYVDGDVEFGTGGTGPLIVNNYEYCCTGRIPTCTKCGSLDITNADKHEHGDDYCTYCGFNKNGESEQPSEQD